MTCGVHVPPGRSPWVQRPEQTKAALVAAFFCAVLFYYAVPAAEAAGMNANTNLEQTSFSALSGWQDDDHLAAFRSFMRFCAPDARSRGVKNDVPETVCGAARALDAEGGVSQASARAFFETRFTPYRFGVPGFVTGYFEPELAASRRRHGPYQHPLLQAPQGLTAVTSANRPRGWPSDLSHGRKTADGLVPLPDRGRIMAGALADEGLELVWLKNPIDAFFVHVQGSARLRLDDGTAMRVGYAGKTGHPYSSIARILVRRGEGTPEDLTMSGLRAWLEAHPDHRDALFRENQSFIFFREIPIVDPVSGPIGATGLPLVGGRSLAVDPAHVPYGFPVFVASKGLAEVGDERGNTARLMIADDTGSAIRGVARGDIFVGSGEDAGRIAGEIRHRAAMTLLVPNGSEGLVRGLKQVRE